MIVGPNLVGMLFGVCPKTLDVSSRDPMDKLSLMTPLETNSIDITIANE